MDCKMLLTHPTLLHGQIFCVLNLEYGAKQKLYPGIRAVSSPGPKDVEQVGVIYHFCDFRKWTHCCRLGIFLVEFHFKKSAKFPFLN